MSQNLDFQHSVNMILSSKNTSQAQDTSSAKELILARASIGSDNSLLNTYAGQIAQFILEGNWQSALGLYDFILEHGSLPTPPKTYYMFWDNGGEYSDHTIQLYEIPIFIPAHEAKLFLEEADEPDSSWKPFVISIHNSITFCNDSKGNRQIATCDFNEASGFSNISVTLDRNVGNSEKQKRFEHTWKYITLEIAKHHVEYASPYYQHWQDCVKHNYDRSKMFLTRFISEGRVPTWSEYVAGARSF